MFKFFRTKKVVMAKEEFDKLVFDNQRRKEMIELSAQEMLDLIKTNKNLEVEIKKLRAELLNKN